MDLGVSGLASGFDWRSLVDQMAEVERLPQRRLLVEQNKLEQRGNSYGSIATQMSVLKNRVAALKESGLFNGRTAATGNAEVATASASAGAVLGNYTFSFSQLASAAKWNGSTNAGRPLSTDSDVSDVVLQTSGFATTPTAGTFRVNGAEVTIAATDTLEDVFGKISDATDGDVTASYDETTDRIRLQSNSAIVLGSATDTSNFLDVAKLYNNGTGNVSSASALGSVRLSSALSASNLGGTLTYGGGGSSGTFKVNGVEIAYSSSDTMSDVLARISKSDAGVTASYDLNNDRFVLANKATGDIGIALEDVSGNFLSATGLSGGSLSRGTDLLYTVNGGGQLRSHSNTVTASSSGLTGLSVTALKAESVTVTVSSDRDRIRGAIEDFLDEYNAVQKTIAKETSISTDAKGAVTAGVLASESDAEGIAATLRRLTYSQVTGLDGDLKHIEALGIKSNSDDDTLKLDDEDALDAALSDRLDEVQALFLDSETGIVTRLEEYLEKTAGDEGSLQTKRDVLTKQSAGIDTQISDLERVVQANREQMIQTFVSMEKAQANIKQQLQYLTQRFGG